jgi:hypothetical protein
MKNSTSQGFDQHDGFDHRVGHLWALRMMLESSKAPFLMGVSTVASPIEKDGVADARIEVSPLSVKSYTFPSLACGKLPFTSGNPARKMASGW